MENSTAVTVCTDPRGRALITKPARRALRIDGLLSLVEFDLRLLCIVDDDSVQYPDNLSRYTITTYVDDQGRFSIPAEVRRDFGIDGQRAILEVRLTVQDRDPL